MAVVKENVFQTTANRDESLAEDSRVCVDTQAENLLQHRDTIVRVVNLVEEPCEVSEIAEAVRDVVVDSSSGGKTSTQSQGGGAEALVLSNSRTSLTYLSRPPDCKPGVDVQLAEKPVMNIEPAGEACDGGSCPPIGTAEEVKKTEEEDPTIGVSLCVTVNNSSHDMLNPVVEAKAVLHSSSRLMDSNLDLAKRNLDTDLLEGASQSSSEGDSQEDDLDDDDDEEESEETFHTSEGSLKEEDIEELVELLLVAESEATHAQEILEEESLLQLRNEVEKELGETLSGEELKLAVEEEMTAYIEQWEDIAEEIEERSAVLQEKLEDAGVSLTHLFKWIEKQIPEVCTTEAWKRRTLWVGHEPTEEVEKVLNTASEELKIKHPTRSHRGKILDEGASGFLERKLAEEEGGFATHESSQDDGWSKVEDFLDNDESAGPGQLMGTKRWAAVYLASTPEQAAQLGLTLPGIDTVEEIGDIETGKGAIFKAALKNERERGLTEGQKKSIKKVREEDDVRKIRRRQKRSRQKSLVSKHVCTLRKCLPDVKDKRPPGTSLGDIVTAKEADNVPIFEDSMSIFGKASSENVVSNTSTSSAKSRPKWKSEDVTEVIDLLSDDESDHGDIRSTRKQLNSHPFEPTRTEPSPDGNRNVVATLKVEAGEYEPILHILNGSGDARNGLLHEPAASRENLDLSIVEWKASSRLDGELAGPSSQSPILSEEGSGKKRTFEGFSAGDDEESSSKKFKSVYIVDESGLVNETKVESPVESETELKQPPPEHTSSKNYLVRRTVVIDSDGEREVEEALTGHPTSKDSPRGEVTCDTKQLVCYVKDERLGHEVIESSLTHAVPAHPELDRVETWQMQANGRKRKARYESDMRVKCTSCHQLMKVYEVLRHPNPRLPVAVCKKCTRHYLSGPFRKDEDGSDSECSWCGEGGKVVCCSRCDKVFCENCITKNFDAKEYVRVCADDYWLCFFCNDTPLAHLTQELVTAESELERLIAGDRQIVYVESDEPTRYEESSLKYTKRGRHRKNIRKMLSDDELEEKQKELLAREKERQERLEHWQSVSPVPPHQFLASREISQLERETVPAEYESQPEVTIVGLPINAVRDPDEEPIFIAPSFADVLKPHQIEGVQFMWQNCMESLKKIKNDPDGVGCILAHSMGLGKTLQVITFLHTVLTSELLWFKTALIVVPVNVLHNWKREFEMWQDNLHNPIPVYILDDSIRENSRRAQLLISWHKGGGVMLIGYSAFRNLSNGKHVKDKVTRDSLCESLQNPGPDILVCDEAHMIKNGKADITQVLKQVRSKRRVALTGSPLQNNLMEYYCMVDFVREGFLGTPTVFKNRFQNPIENGQHCDSTASDVRVMKMRAHVLNKTLRGFVQRKDSSVLKGELPPKCVYVISVRLSNLQRRLYEHYLQIHGMMHDDDEALENKTHRRLLFNAYHSFSKIWNHPDLLLLAQEEKIRRQQEDSYDEFANESDEEKLSETDAAGGNTSSCADVKLKFGIGNRSWKRKGVTDHDELENSLWWKDIMEGSSREDVNLSGKMVLLLELLSMSAARGDKTLVFSQSLGTLDIIEKFMETRLFLPAEGRYWEHDKHWYRLDGSTPAAARMCMCERFNNPTNTDVKCVLISTRAGSLGINLPAANRVVIVDGSWNPTHDLQALFRAWRLGQRKPVFAYRLLACGTMEEKIYNRQVAKEGVAARVLDKNYPERIFNGDDLEFLFRLEPDDDDFVSKENDGYSSALDTSMEHASTSSSSGLLSIVSASKNKLSSFNVPDDAPPVDDIMGKLLLDHRPRWVVRYHEHEPLLEHQEKEDLSAEERQYAWSSIEVGAQNNPLQNVVTTVALSGYYQSLDDLTIVHSTPSGHSRPSCSSKDHAALLSEYKVEVSEQILCNSCKQHISWNDISTGHKKFL
ncbi:hypothetical protein Mp_5g21000 [Marchantia polymorpha subsp. ruderalis]|nr:hypothetical protein MARPO_0058s0081 [Marchantia polymorpha]BBN12547.1 hypothetical protein Mp_5g21000 [Marchantia polymorpha subsp. ruderalis]|eukprot:PTQ37302.1 hypothetical protein MARPO_0058s0081 [Marchantia polymorpha]